jgi:hypothetical protein
MAEKKKIKKDDQQPNIVIYITDDGQAKLQVKIEDETVWLTQDQMAELFDKGRSTVAEHTSKMPLRKANLTKIQYVGNSDELVLIKKNIA